MHLLGQPFTIEQVSVPVNAILTCHCAPSSPPMAVHAGGPVRCPVCQQVYTVAMHPQTGQILVAKVDQISISAAS